MNQPCTEQNFIPKKKKKPNQREFTVQTRRNFIKRKKKSWLLDEKGQFCPTYIFLIFFLIFFPFWRD